MTTLKVDFLTYSGATGDITFATSGVTTSGDYAIATGLINPSTQAITTTGNISGYTYKTSGNVTVIAGAGTVTPYGLYALPSGVPSEGSTAIYEPTGNTSWRTLTTTALTIALGKC